MLDTIQAINTRQPPQCGTIPQRPTDQLENQLCLILPTLTWAAVHPHRDRYVHRVRVCLSCLPGFSYHHCPEAFRMPVL